MFKNNFRAIRKRFGLSQAELASKLGTTQQTIAKWEAGRSSPSPSMLARIAITMGVSADDLVLDREQRELIYRGREKPESIMDDMPGRQDVKAEVNGHSYFTAQDDSMAPAICAGDELLIRHQITLDEGDVALVSLDDREPALRRIHMQDGGYLLQPLNSSFSAVYITKSNQSRLKIWGKAMELRRDW